MSKLAISEPAPEETREAFVLRPLDELCLGVFDCPHTTPALAEVGPYIVRSQDIRSGVFRYETAGRVTEDTYRERIARAEPTFGDVLLSREGTYFGIAAEVPRDMKVCLGQRMVLIRPNPCLLDARYLRYWINSPRMAAHVAGFRDGSVAERLNMPTIRALPIGFRPLHEQRAIAAVLGTLDDKIEANRRINATLEAMARALFKSWFVDFDPVRAKMEGREPAIAADLAALFPARLTDSPRGPIPEGWGVVPLPTVFDLNPRTALESSRDAVYVDMAALPTSGARVQETARRPPGSGARFKNGDVLLARITPCLENGKTALVDFLAPNEVAWGSTEFVVFRPKAHLPALWMYALARTEEFRAFAIQNMSGSSGRQRVGVDAFEKWTTPLCGADIGEAFRSILAPSFGAMKVRDDQSRTIAQLRDLLLPKLLSGSVPVRDAEAMVEDAA